MKKKHSEFGIASFIIIGLLVLVFYLGTGSESFAVLLESAVLLMAPLALVLGIAGLKQKDRKKVFSVIGITISILILVFWGVILIFYGLGISQSIS